VTQLRRSFALFLLTFVMSSTAFAESESQFHIRIGAIKAVYWGSDSGDFFVPTMLDLEYETFLSNTRSLIFRSMLAMELETAKPYYAYSGAGMRYYLGSKGMLVESQGEGVAISAIPKVRYYIGWDAGISQAIIQSLGRILTVTSTMIDFGGNAGVIYQVDRKFGVEFHAGATSAQGFSSVSVVGVTVRATAGITYQF